MKKLEEWKKSGHKPLLILGARQTGKSWLMEEFGHKNYRNVIHVELEDTPVFKAMFENVTDPGRILSLLEVYSQSKIDPEDSLVILDEIQETPNALTSLKYFNEKAPEYHVMAAGSYLGTSIHKKQSFPVGKVEILELKPMSFYEFLLALGQSGLANLIQERKVEEAQVFESRLKDLLGYYYFVGGMPEAVSVFAETHDLVKVRSTQNTLLTEYRKDFSKHIPTAELVKVYQVWDSVPEQLAKENKKFIYGELKKGARASQYEAAIQWLVDTGLLYKINRIDRPFLPLKAYEDHRAFKLYFLDVGLLGAAAGLQPETLLDGSIFFVEFKGALSEQFVLQELKLQTDSVYYWSASKSKGEVDFVIEDGGKVWPIEVKSGTNAQSKSLRSFIEKYGLKQGIRLSLLPYRKQDWLTNFPFYFSGQLLNFISNKPSSFVIQLPDDTNPDSQQETDQK